jgi:hypothetical protein
MSRLIYLAALAILLLPGCANTNQLVSGNTNECVNVPWHGSHIDGTHGQVIGVGGACLDVQGGAATDGAGVIFVTCNGSPSQHWNVTNGQIVGIGGKCLDITDGNPSDRAPLIIAPCTGSPSQQWSVH